SISRVEATARLTPLSFVSVVGTAGRSKDQHAPDSTSTANFLRAEAAIRFFGLWFAGGVVRRDSVLLLPPRVFGPYEPVEEPSATGITGRIEGRLYKALRLNIQGIRWNDSSGFYWPRYQA